MATPQSPTPENHDGPRQQDDPDERYDFDEGDDEECFGYGSCPADSGCDECANTAMDYLKFMFEGIKTLPALSARLRELAEYYDALTADGWAMTQTIDGGAWVWMRKGGPASPSDEAPAAAPAS